MSPTAGATKNCWSDLAAHAIFVDPWCETLWLAGGVIALQLGDYCNLETGVRDDVTAMIQLLDSWDLSVMLP